MMQQIVDVETSEMLIADLGTSQVNNKAPVIRIRAADDDAFAGQESGGSVGHDFKTAKMAAR